MIDLETVIFGTGSISIIGGDRHRSLYSYYDIDRAQMDSTLILDDFLLTEWI